MDSPDKSHIGYYSALFPSIGRRSETYLRNDFSHSQPIRNNSFNLVLYKLDKNQFETSNSNKCEPSFQSESIRFKLEVGIIELEVSD